MTTRRGPCPCRNAPDGPPACERELFEGYRVRFVEPVERVRQLTPADVLRDLARVERRFVVVGRDQ